MKIDLTEKEIQLLKGKNISLDTSRDYTEDEALALLERVRDLEAEYAQDFGNEREKLYFMYGDLGDKIQKQIPAE